MRAVLDEAMRLYPPVATLSRQAIADDTILGARVPAGTIVPISPYVLHRRRGLWENPDAFDPSRFLGERRERIDRFAYIPFGAGPRVCIGMAFATQEAIIILANLLRAFRFDMVEGRPGHAAAAGDVAAAGRLEDARKTARIGGDIHSRKFLCESALTENRAGPISRPPTARRAFQAA